MLELDLKQSQMSWPFYCWLELKGIVGYEFLALYCEIFTYVTDFFSLGERQPLYFLDSDIPITFLIVHISTPAPPKIDLL